MHAKVNERWCAKKVAAPLLERAFCKGSSTICRWNSARPIRGHCSLNTHRKHLRGAALLCALRAPFSKLSGSMDLDYIRASGCYKKIFGGNLLGCESPPNSNCLCSVHAIFMMNSNDFSWIWIQCWDNRIGNLWLFTGKLSILKNTYSMRKKSFHRSLDNWKYENIHTQKSHFLETPIPPKKECKLQNCRRIISVIIWLVHKVFDWKLCTLCNCAAKVEELSHMLLVLHRILMRGNELRSQQQVEMYTTVRQQSGHPSNVAPFGSRSFKGTELSAASRKTGSPCGSFTCRWPYCMARYRSKQVKVSASSF